jgi:hypothetical protein
MSDQFDKNLREHLHHEAEEIREFPRPLRGRIREGITPRTKSRMAPQLALAGALVLVAFAVVVVRNPQVILKDVPATIKQILQPSPAPTPQPFTCSDHSGGSAGLNAQLTGIRVASHEADGYDRIVFDFTGGVPSYDLSRQESATFIRDASGQSLPLDGSAGIKLVFRDTDAGPGVPVDTAPRLKSVREIAQVGNFERVLSYGVGLSSAQCLRTQELSGPSRLVVDVASSPSASASAAPTPLPTQPAATDLGAFTCQDRSGGASGSATMQLTDVRIAHQPGYDRLVFEFAAPAGATARVPAYTLSRQASANFVKDPSGQAVTMRGSYGLRVVFHQASGVGSYTKSQDIKAGLPVVQEVEQLGDFEAVLSWGAGLSRASCVRTLELANPTRLVIDVQTP